MCLRLAAEHPQEVDGIAAALRVHLDRASTPDRELLQAVLLLLSEDWHAGIGALQRLDDPRARRTLVAVATTADLPIATDAVAALADHPQALDRLVAWLRDADARLEIRVASVHALGALGDPRGADAVIDMLRRPELPTTLRDALDTVLAEDFPDRVEEARRHVAEDGTAWISVGSGWGLGLAMGAAGHFGAGGLALPGVATGATTGATAGYLFGRAWPWEAGDAAFVTTSGMQGTAAGLLVGIAVDPSADGAWMGSFTGGLAGFGLGWGLRRVHRGRAGDALEAQALSVALGLGGGALGAHVAGLDAPATRLSAGVGLAVGAVLGHAVAPTLDPTSADALLIGATAGLGAAAGALAPTAPDDAALPIAGAALGASGGYLLARVTEVPVDVAVGSTAGAAFGAPIGLGLGRLSGGDPALEGSLAVAGLGLGAVTGAVGSVLDPAPVDDRDIAMVAVATGWTAWQAAGWATVAEARRAGRGWVFLLPPLVGASTASASHRIDVPIPHTMTAASMGLWSAWFGAAAGELAGVDPLTVALITSDVGLLGGSVVLSPAVGAPPLVLGLADAGGVLGAAMGIVGASATGLESRGVLLAAAAGSAGGLTGGAVMGAIWYRAGTRDHASLRPMPTGTRVALLPWAPDPTGWGARVSLEGW